MPIAGLSDVRRLPRLGKLRLGIKVTPPAPKKPYPKAVDYFVVPDAIKQYVGDQPRVLDIIFPVDDPEFFAAQYLKCYSTTQGLVCKGDGQTCRRKVDLDTGDFAGQATKRWEYREGACDPKTCPKAVRDPDSDKAPPCRGVMNLMFCLPDVPGLGVWQLDTGSWNSMVNINSALELIGGRGCRVRGIPLKLSLEPQEVNPLGTGTKKTVHVLQLRSDLKLLDLVRKGLGPVPLIPAPDAAEEEEPPDDLFPPEVMAEQEAGASLPAGTTAAAPVPAGKTAAPKRIWERVKPRSEWEKVVPADVPDYGHLLPILFRLAGMQPEEVYRELGGSRLSDMSCPAWDGFLTIKELVVPLR